MDTITTIPNLLKSNGSAQAVMLLLTPKESDLIAAAPELLEAILSIVGPLNESGGGAMQIGYGDEKYKILAAAIAKASPASKGA